MLAAALPVARSLGITRALLTCDEDNIASRKMIEANAACWRTRAAASSAIGYPHRDGVNS